MEVLYLHNWVKLQRNNAKAITIFKPPLHRDLTRGIAGTCATTVSAIICLLVGTVFADSEVSLKSSSESSLMSFSLVSPSLFSLVATYNTMEKYD
jgi:hypothetical protein